MSNFDNRHQAVVDVQLGLQARGLYLGKIDGDDGPKTWAAITALIENEGWCECEGTTFAYPEDIAAFKKCKATGKTDNECFAVGDNGIGYWNADTTSDEVPMCALQKEIIEARFGDLAKAESKLIEVARGDKSVVCRLEDLDGEPGIDLNPAAANALGIALGDSAVVKWRWA